jgi:hypothetical protein
MQLHSLAFKMEYKVNIYDCFDQINRVYFVAKPHQE